MIRPFGDRAFLVELATIDEVTGLHAALAASQPPGVRDVVPAARTVLVVRDPALLSDAAARAWVRSARATPGAGDAPPHRTVEVPVVYDGPDLGDAASAVGVGPDALVARHLAASWSVAFTGFAPGFGYLVSAEWPFDVPRLESPRPRVPRGSIGLAGEFSGAYPRETPGGWRLIGRTDAPLFDPAGVEPVLLTPGTTVRFRPVRAAAEVAEPQPVRTAGPTAFTVVDPGPLATVQDRGRPGRQADGVAPSGAADRGALQTANRLVGNTADAAGVEVLLGGFRAVADRDLWVAVTGAWGAIRIGGRVVDPYAPVRWPAGDELELDRFRAGVRAYLAVRGGLGGPAVFGSRATDTLAGLGPAPMRAGDAVATADAEGHPIPVVDAFPWTPPGGALDIPAALEIPVAPGPRADWFAPAAHRALFEADWVVGAQADRVGLRLDGPVLDRTAVATGRELPSEGMLPGALQVPPEGRPVVLGPDGPVTGGYPVIGVVTDAGLDLLAQARPGTHLRLRRARPLA